MILLAAALGLVAGVGLTVVVDRVPARERLWPLRFHCPRCPGARDLAAEIDMREEALANGREPPEPAPGGPTEMPGLPLASVLVPGRPCPSCGAGLGARYWPLPWVTAAAFAGAAAVVGATWALPAHLLLAATLVAVTVIDLELRIIPNRVVYPALVASVALLGIAAVADDDPARMGTALAGAGLAWAFLALLWVVSPASMGFGDVRLGLVLGLFLGWQSLLHVLFGVFFGFALAAVIGAGLMVVGRAGRRTQVPFGPFLAAGTALVLVWGDGLSRWWGV